MSGRAGRHAELAGRRGRRSRSIARREEELRLGEALKKKRTKDGTINVRTVCAKGINQRFHVCFPVPVRAPWTRRMRG